MIAYFSCQSGGYGATAYQVINGSLITEEFNETLDSATIRLAPINSPLSDIAPYQEVKLVQGSSEWLFLIDRFTETQMNNREDGKIYSYEISLMSMTKYLEKIQLPNITITHRAEDRDTIAQVIQRLYRYVPKIRFDRGDGTWWHDRYLELDQRTNTKFNVPCADMQLSQPTLRQALTAVMTQIGCIPIVRGHEISWIDLREEAQDSGLDDTQIIVSRSQSSDSYVNSLVNMSGGLLDSTGKSVSERLCFRDRSNFLLKQLENLKLETRFPIYKVNSIKAHAFFDDKLHFGNTTENDDFRYYYNIYRSTGSGYAFTFGGTSGNWSFLIDRGNDTGSLTITSFSGTLYNYKMNDDPYFKIEKAGESQNINLGSVTITIGGTYTIPISSALQSSANLLFIGRVTLNDGRSWNIMTMTGNRLLISENSEILGYTFVSYALDGNIYAHHELDITVLCKESVARSGLSVDYVALNAITSRDINDYAQYFYSTFEYSIGGNEITGFSQNYTVSSNGFWDRTNSVIEKICKDVDGWSDFYESIDDDFARNMLEAFEEILPENLYSYGEYGDTPMRISATNNRTPINPYTGTSTKSFSTMFFDVVYQPISSPNLKFTRENGTFPLEQLDSKQNGLSSVEKVSASEYETVERLGSDVVCIHQRVSSADEIAELNTLYGDYTIFKRSIAFKNNFLEVDYYASKKYVLKNYFTSIVTKYRAYQYVDLNQAVTRIENLHFFLDIRDNEAIPYGTDNFTILIDGEGKSNATRYWDYLFADGLMFNGSKDGIEKSAKNYFSDPSQVKYLDEVSVTHSDKFFALTAFDFDNASKGIYVDGTYISGTHEQTTEQIGGIPQRYYGAQDNLLSIYFCSKLPYFDLDASLNDIQALPRYSHDFDPKYAIRCNSSDLPLYYKDGTERLGETIDVEVCNHVDGFSFNENMISHSSMLSLGDTSFLGVFIIPNLGDLLSADDKRQLIQSGVHLYYYDEDGNQQDLENTSLQLSQAQSNSILFKSNNAIVFNFARFATWATSVGINAKTATICFAGGTLGNFYLKDVCRFENNGGHYYSLMFAVSDVKGKDVYRFSNGLLIADKEVVMVNNSSATADWVRNSIDKGE